MQSRGRLKSLLVVVATLFVTSIFAQTTATKNTYSLYSMYGIGDIATQGTLSTRSMGGAGVGNRSAAHINLLNPASYSIAIRQGILMDIGFEGSLVTNVQKSGDATSKSSYLAGTISNIALQIPIAKGLGVGFSLAPYSTIGYNINTYDTTQPEVGLMTKNYQGTGEITVVKFGAGYKLAKRLSVGLSANYYWGLIDRYYSLAVYPTEGVNEVSPMQAVDGTYISKIMGQVGVQWDAYAKGYTRLSVAATYDIGGNVSPEDDLIVTSGSSSDVAGLTSVDDTTSPALYMPHKLTLGATYNDRKWHAAADYTFEAWNGNAQELSSSGFAVAYCNVSTVKMGLEYTPNKLDSRRYFKRASYRAGTSVGNYYQTFGGKTLMEWNVTAGMGLPINLFGMSNVDVGVEYGSLGSTKSYGGANLVRQNYFKFSMGVTLFGDDYWFQRVKYD